jgi:threonine aldolase
MRQAGVLAAAGLIALRDGPAGMIDRLAEDHANARLLAERLADEPGIVSAGGIAQPATGQLDPTRVRTNFVLFRVAGDRRAFAAALRRQGVLIDEYAHGQIRAATHHGITAEDIDAVVPALRAALATVSGQSTEPDEARHLQGV